MLNTYEHFSQYIYEKFLLMADELHEARLNSGKPGLVPPAQPAPSTDGVAEALNAVAARIEKIVQGI